MKNCIPIALLALAMGVTRRRSRGTPEEDLLEAIRQSDVAAVKKLLDAGVSANAKYRYDRSALSFAADRGNAEIVTLLLDRARRSTRKGHLLQDDADLGRGHEGPRGDLAALLAKATPVVQGDALFPSHPRRQARRSFRSVLAIAIVLAARPLARAGDRRARGLPRWPRC